MEDRISLGQVTFKKRGAKKSAMRKRAATPPPVDSDSSGYISTEDEGRRIKRRKKSALVTANSKASTKAPHVDDLATTTFAADRSAQIEETNDATKQSNWFDEKDLLGTSRARPEKFDTNISTQSDGNDGIYKGAAGYQSFIAKNPDAPNRQVGPVKAPTNIRTITVTDFAPDVCKDYKQTGFCGFGDSCKFLHAREDYKQGWQLDKDWEVGTKGKKNGVGRKKAGEVMDSDEENAALENIPFACIICKKPYTNPILTKCGHYFCEACALHRYKKGPSCAACGAGTGGVFNGAKGLKKLLEKKKERARRKKEKAIENGEEVSEEDEINGNVTRT